MATGDFEAGLARRLAGATRIAVLGIGDDLNPLDRPGIVGAILIHEIERPNVTVFLTGTMPENYTGAIRNLRPSHVLMIDTADMGLSPGSLGIVHPAKIHGQRFSTHMMPLSLVIEYLEKELDTTVVLVGIQPDPVAPSEGIQTPFSLHVVEGLLRLRDAFSRTTQSMW